MTTYKDSIYARVTKTTSETDAISNFEIKFVNPFGKHSDEFSLNQEVTIYSDVVQPSEDPVVEIFKGIVEDIKFQGSGTNERMTITGRDYGATLQDVMVDPRIFRDTEVSVIVTSIMAQNIKDLTVNNVQTTTTTLEKVTFSNISVYDALKQLAELSGYYFYVDLYKDLHFEPRNSISSGLTFDNTNVLSGHFRTADHEIFNHVEVSGERQLTGARDIYVTGTDNTGSVYYTNGKPYNVQVQYSGTTNTFLQPGGVENLDDPSTDNSKYLVGFQEGKITLTSGTAAGDNTLPNGSVLIIDYQRSTPLIRVKEDVASIQQYGRKEKIIVNNRIKDINEANEQAQSFLDEYSQPKVEGDLLIKGYTDITPGQTVVVNLPWMGQNNQTYAIIEATYEFTSDSVNTDRTLRVKLNKNIADFIDIMKDQMLRLRKLEGRDLDSNITNVELATGSVGVSGTTEMISRSIGSGFYFHVPGHNQLNSPTALLGDMRAGSTVINI